jgi:hypothetical protein
MIKFGFNSVDLEPLARRLESVLGVRLDPHESDFHGGEYYRGESRSGPVLLKTNYDPVDQEPFESSWPEKQAILYLDGADDSEWRDTVRRLRAIADEFGAKYLGESIG